MATSFALPARLKANQWARWLARTGRTRDGRAHRGAPSGAGQFGAPRAAPPGAPRARSESIIHGAGRLPAAGRSSWRVPPSPGPGAALGGGARGTWRRRLARRRAPPVARAAPERANGPMRTGAWATHCHRAPLGTGCRRAARRRSSWSLTAPAAAPRLAPGRRPIDRRWRPAPWGLGRHQPAGHIVCVLGATWPDGRRRDERGQAGATGPRRNYLN